MAQTNKYGVPRTIPEPVKREVRRRCGFGCVVCGSPFYDYEHWNPEFSELRNGHSPDGIALCCPNCHRKKGTLISIDQYHEAIKSPRALVDGFSKTEWSVEKEIVLVIGTVRCVNINQVLVVDGVPIIAFVEPEVRGAPPRLIARFYDGAGNEQFRIDHNECIGNPGAWDITSTRIGNEGWRWVVRRALGEIDLDVAVFPPNRIEVRRMNMQFGFLSVRANEKGFQVVEMTSDKGKVNRFYLSKGTVSANGNLHVFFGIQRTYTPNFQQNILTVRHYFRMNHVTIDAEEGAFSLADNQEFI